MMYVLVAVYLAAGSATPEMQTRQYASGDKCREHAARYVKQAQVGQSRAFCLKVKGTS